MRCTFPRVIQYPNEQLRVSVNIPFLPKFEAQLGDPRKLPHGLGGVEASWPTGLPLGFLLASQHSNSSACSR